MGKGYDKTKMIAKDKMSSKVSMDLIKRNVETITDMSDKV